MTTRNTGQRTASGTHSRPTGTVDFTFMYAAHDAFSRDLRRLAAAAAAGRTAEDPAVRTGWATFARQLHVHHTAEDKWLWPALRDKVTRADEVAVLDAMEAEHLDLDPLIAQVESSLAAGLAGLTEAVSALTEALTAHMEHEEDHALPLVETYLGPEGWAAFGKSAGKTEGLRGAAELFPWILDGAPADTTKRVLGMLPPPARLLYRALWRPGYARTPRWGSAPD